MDSPIIADDLLRLSLDPTIKLNITTHTTSPLLTEVLDLLLIEAHCGFTWLQLAITPMESPEIIALVRLLEHRGFWSDFTIDQPSDIIVHWDADSIERCRGGIL